MIAGVYYFRRTCISLFFAVLVHIVRYCMACCEPIGTNALNHTGNEIKQHEHESALTCLAPVISPPQNKEEVWKQGDFHREQLNQNGASCEKVRN